MKRRVVSFILIMATVTAALLCACANSSAGLPVPALLDEEEETEPSPKATIEAPIMPTLAPSPSPTLPQEFSRMAVSMSPTPSPVTATIEAEPTETKTPQMVPPTPTPLKTEPPMTEPPTPTPPSQTVESMEMVPLTQAPAMFRIPSPKAPGTDVLGNDKAEIDVSNKRDGYIMVRYIAVTAKKLRVIITGPSKTGYTYTLNGSGEYEVYPLSDGNGEYAVNIYENISGSKYSTAYAGSFDVKLKNEFAPFLRPNQYVNYSSSSKAVKKAAVLTQNEGELLGKIAAIYHFVIENIAYDKALAKSISAKVVTEYLPNIDKVLSSGKGICFDYAALMTAMLRSQGIPCKLVVGYAGSVYHAWISVYSETAGWLDDVIYFDGKGWKLMDPTYASSGRQSSDVMDYIGDGKNYTAKYLY